MKKQTLFTFLYVALIIGLILFMLWLIFWLKSESSMCVRDPLNYYAEKTDQQCIGKNMRHEISCVPIDVGHYTFNFSSLEGGK